MLALHLPDLTQIHGWIEAGGYLALFGLLFACGLGLPLPEDIPLIVAGALIANGKMHFALAGVCAWCGIIGGDIMLYNIGKKFGLEVTRLPFIGKHVTKARIEQLEQMFHNYGVGVVALGRLLAGIRGAMVLAAGTIRYNFVKFIIVDGLAALVSGGLWILLGYWLGNNLTEARIHKFKEWFIAGAVLIILGFIAWVLWSRRHKKVVIDAEVKIVEKVSEVAKKVQPKAPEKKLEEEESKFPE